MERQQTDNLLKPHASGTYLIRERPAEAERFAISIKCVADPRPRPLQARGSQGRAGRGLSCPDLDTSERSGVRGSAHRAGPGPS